MPSTMTVNDIVSIIKDKFTDLGGEALIPLQRGGCFKAILV